jgi:hypothetical protein
VAKVKKNVILEGISGKLGDQVVLRHFPDGRTIVAAMPDFSNRVFSTAQTAQQTKFKAASTYAKATYKVEPLYAQLAAGTPRNAYNVALADYMHAPVIHQIKREGSRLKIQASDTVLVTAVSVTLLDADGTVLEKGEAQQGDVDWWEYTLQGSGKISVEARDLAGNVTKAEMESL